MLTILSYTFFQHALLGGILSSLLCAVVGTYVYTRRTVIAGGGVAHASLGGVGAGAYFGFSPQLGALGCALLSALTIQWLARRRYQREDAAIALVWTLGVSLGILFAYGTPGFITDLPAYLFGDILACTRTDLYFTGALAAAAWLLHAAYAPAIACTALDRDFAATQGLRVGIIETTATVFTACAVVACLRSVGIVMVVSLLSIPQMTAARFVRSYTGMIVFSALFGVVSTTVGLFLSYAAGVPSGACIILTCIALYALSAAGGWAINWLRAR